MGRWQRSAAAHHRPAERRARLSARQRPAIARLRPAYQRHWHRPPQAWISARAPRITKPPAAPTDRAHWAASAAACRSQKTPARSSGRAARRRPETLPSPARPARATRVRTRTDATLPASWGDRNDVRRAVGVEAQIETLLHGLGSQRILKSGRAGGAGLELQRQRRVAVLDARQRSDRRAREELPGLRIKYREVVRRGLARACAQLAQVAFRLRLRIRKRLVRKGAAKGGAHRGFDRIGLRLQFPAVRVQPDQENYQPDRGPGQQ